VQEINRTFSHTGNSRKGIKSNYFEGGFRMQNLRNKKRLVSLAVVFALVFMVGAAFAFSGAILVQGNVQVAGQGYVRWCTANTSLGSTFGNVGHDYFVGWGSTGLTNQVIVWDIQFGEAGFATLSAAARNDSGANAQITSMNVSWQDNMGNVMNPADFGLTVDFSGTNTAFSNATIGADGGISPILEIEVEWDGSTPANFTGSNDGWLLPDPTGILLGFAGNLVIEFEYAPI
jgi:hypothetical protein